VCVYVNGEVFHSKHELKRNWVMIIFISDVHVKNAANCVLLTCISSRQNKIIYININNSILL